MHNHILNIDTIAQTSKLNTTNPTLKIGVGILSLIFCVLSQSILFQSIVAFIMILIVIKYTKLSMLNYMRLLRMPSIFLVLSSVAFMVQLSRQRFGFIDIPIGRWYLAVTKDSLWITFLVITRAYASITCLFMMSLTTPIADVIHVC